MNKTYYFHGKTIDGQRYTIAGQFVARSLILGIALCSLKDNFIKSLGRVKAEGRIQANSDHGYMVIDPEEYIEHQQGKTFLNSVEGTTLLPGAVLMRNFNL